MKAKVIKLRRDIRKEVAVGVESPYCYVDDVVEVRYGKNEQATNIWMTPVEARRVAKALCAAASRVDRASTKKGGRR